MKLSDVEKAFKDAKVTVRKNYDDDRANPFVVDVSEKLGHKFELEASDAEEARARALEAYIHMDPTVRGNNIEGVKDLTDNNDKQ